MLELNTNELELKFNGVDKKLRYPTMSELMTYEKEVIDDKLREGATSKLFLKLGLDKETCELLQADHIKKIMEAFKPKK